MRKELVSYSRIRALLACPYRYNLVYNKNITPRVDDRTPTLGSAGHAGLAAGILGRNVDEALEAWAQDYLDKHLVRYPESEDTMTEDEISFVGEVTEDMNSVITTMTDEVKHTASLIVPRALEALHLDEWETIEYRGVPLVEAKFIIPIEGWMGYTAVIDWVARHRPTNMTWLIDHKFRKTLQSDDLEEFNLQMSSYQYVLGVLGIRTVGSMANQILTKLPTLPSRNKDGTMSRARISSTWEVYKGALLAAGLDPEDYLDMKDKLTTEFFRHSYSYRSELEVANTWENLIKRSALAMNDENYPYLRNLGSLGCRNCWARDYCMEELRGGDLDYMLRTQFMVRPERTIDENERVIIFREEEGSE